MGRAYATYTLPDGTRVTEPLGRRWSGAPSDPILFANTLLGPGACDCDHDADDQLGAKQGLTVHCDGDRD